MDRRLNGWVEEEKEEWMERIMDGLKKGERVGWVAGYRPKK